VDDGFGLACQHCRFVFPIDITVGVLAAHFETEHDTTDVRVELVVLCPRCTGVMELLHTVGNKLHYGCAPCHRTRIVTQEADHA
jgi:hypothetical protein